MKRLVAAGLLGCAFGAAPQPALAPLALHDSDEIERYVAAFPAADYSIVESPRAPLDCPRHGWLLCMRIWWQTPYIGRFYIEPPPRDPTRRTWRTATCGSRT